MGERDNQYTFALKPEQQTGKFINSLVVIAHIQYLLFLLLSAISFIIHIRRQKELNILPILIIGFILVHILVEAQARYRYEFYIFIVIFSADPISYCIEKAKAVPGSKKSKHRLLLSYKELTNKFNINN